MPETKLGLPEHTHTGAGADIRTEPENLTTTPTGEQALKLLFLNAQVESAAKVIQKFWVNKQLSNAQSVNADHTRRFTRLQANLRSVQLLLLNLPIDETYRHYAELINSGDYITLVQAFDNDPTPHLLNALQTELITDEQLATAHLLWNSTLWFRHQKIRQFAWGEGPYHLNSIGYINSEMKAQHFFESLRTIPKSERCYFTVDIPNHCLMLIFYEALQDRVIFTYHPEVESALNRFCQKNHFINPCLTISDPKASAEFFLEQLPVRERNFCQKLFLSHHETERKDYDSISLLASIMKMGEQLPTTCLAPHYDDAQPPSSYLSVVLPTLSSFRLLLNSFHGIESVLPRFTIGEVSTRFIRALDEGENAITPLQTCYSTILSKDARRPVELVMKTIKHHKKVHNSEPWPYMLSWHDLFHCWRNSANPKALFYFLKTLFSQPGIHCQQPFVMSKSLWKLFDLDFSYGNLWQKGELSSSTKRYFFYFFIHKISLSLSYRLLTLVSIIRHPSIWLDFFGMASIDDLIRANGPSNQGLIYLYHKKLLKLYHAYGEETADEILILHAQLNHLPFGITLCQLIEEMGVDNIFYWDKNQGLVVHPHLRELLLPPATSPEIDKMESYQLYIVLFNYLKHHNRIPDLIDANDPKTNTRVTSQVLHCLRFLSINNFPLPQYEKILVKNLKLTLYQTELIFRLNTHPENTIVFLSCRLDTTAQMSIELIESFLRMDYPTNCTGILLEPTPPLTSSLLASLVARKSQLGVLNLARHNLPETIEINKTTLNYLAKSHINLCQFLKYLTQAASTQTEPNKQRAYQVLLNQLDKPEPNLERLTPLILRFIYRNQTPFSLNLLEAANTYMQDNRAHLPEKLISLSRRAFNSAEANLSWERAIAPFTYRGRSLSFENTTSWWQRRFSPSGPTLCSLVENDRTETIEPPIRPR